MNEEKPKDPLEEIVNKHAQDARDNELFATDPGLQQILSERAEAARADEDYRNNPENFNKPTEPETPEKKKKDHGLLKGIIALGAAATFLFTIGSAAKKHDSKEHPTTSTKISENSEQTSNNESLDNGEVPEWLSNYLDWQKNNPNEPNPYAEEYWKNIGY